MKEGMNAISIYNGIGLHESMNNMLYNANMIFRASHCEHSTLVTECTTYLLK